MSRRRTFDPSKPEDGSPAPPARPGEMTVVMKGDPDTVRDKMSLNKVESKRDEESPDQEKKVLSALAQEGLQFQVKRVLPREWEGRDARVIVYNDDTPMLYQDIVDEVRSLSGGKKYRLTIIDPSSGKSVAAKTFTIDADPILKPLAPDDEPEMMKLMEGDSGEEAMAAVDKSFERQVKLAERRVTFEQHQEMLDSLKRKRDKGGTDDPRIAALERQIAEDRHRAEIDRIRQENDKRMSDLEARLAPKTSSQDSALAEVLKSMQAAQAASERRFELMLQQMRDDKANEILREVRNAHKSDGLGSLKEQIQLFSSIATAFGVKLPGHDDEEDGEDDDRPWYEKLGTQIADKFLPKLLDKFDNMEKEGKKVTKEDFMKEIDQYAEKAADEAAQKEREKLARERSLPAPKAQPAAPAAQAPVKELPPAAPGAPPPAAPAAAPPALPTVEQEICLNVSGVVMMIQRELQTRRQFYQWNYEGAWNHLPEDILEKVCTSADCISMFDAFKIPGLKVEEIDELKTKISENPKMVAWLKLGHDELVAWWKEKQQDPTFDPGAEDDEEEETPVA
jgi:hypothetical protein